MTEYQSKIQNPKPVPSASSGQYLSEACLERSRKAEVSKIPYFLLFTAILLYIIVFGVLAVQQHRAFETSALDLGNYDQAMWNAANGRGLALTTLPNISFNRMGLHVEPILYLLLPLYWIWPNPVVLLLVQTLALGLAAWPLFLLARRRLESDWPALAVALAFLLLPATQSVNLFDFHAVALSPLFMLWALYFLDVALEQAYPGGGFWPRKGAGGQVSRWAGGQVGRWAGEQVSRGTEPVLSLPKDGQGSRGTGEQVMDDQEASATRHSSFSPLASSRQDLHHSSFIYAAIFLLLALATKEDVSLLVFMLGLYLMFLRRHWLAGSLIALVGLTWAFVAFGVVLPAHRIGGEQSAYIKYFSGLGETPLEIALSPLTKPRQVFELLFRPENITALQMITLPYAFLGLIGLPVFLIAAPSLAISLLSNNPLQQQLETWHYAAPMLAFISLAAADGMARLSGWAGKQVSNKKPYLLTRLPAHLLAILLVLTSLTYHYYRGYSPLSKPFRWPEVTAHHQLGNELAAAIPPEARVVAQAELVPRVSQREQVSVWAGELPDDADYIFMDVAHPAFLNQDNANVNFASTMVFEDFGIAASRDGYLILKNGAPRIAFQVGFQDFLFANPSWKNKPDLAQFGDEISLLGSEVHLNRETEPQMTLYFRALRQPKEAYFIRLYLLNEQGQVEGATVFQQPNLVWWPTDLWQPGDVIKVRFNTLPWWTGDGQHQRFSYAVAVATETGAVDDPWNESLRLHVTGSGVLPGNLVHLQNFRRVAGMAYPSSK